jgi:hypothetical protein
LWRLDETIEIGTSIGNVRVMREFRFDGCSIPRIMWRVVGHPLQGDALPAGLIHDALYAAKLSPRATADAVFFELLMRYDNGRVKSWVMYRAVRMFGGFAWGGKNGDAATVARKYVHLHPHVIGVSR